MRKINSALLKKTKPTRKILDKQSIAYITKKNHKLLKSHRNNRKEWKRKTEVRKEDKHKKSRKGLRIRQNRHKKPCTGKHSASDRCWLNIVTSMKFEGSIVANFMSQINRFNATKSMLKKKASKFKKFAQTAKDFVNALGGNLTVPVCGRYELSLSYE